MKRLLVGMSLLAGLLVFVLSFSVSAQDTVNVRVAHLSPDTPAVDVYVNGNVAFTGLEYPNVTDFVELAAGTYTIAVAPAGTSVDDAAIGPVDLDLAGGYVTIAALGSLDGGTLTATVIEEDYSGLDDENAVVTIFHAIEGLPAVDVRAGGAVIVDGLSYPNTVSGNDGAYSFAVPAGTYDLSVSPNAANDPVLISAPGTVLEGGATYFIAAIGTPDAPGAIIIEDLLGPGATSGQIGSALDRIFSLGQSSSAAATEEPEEEQIGATSEDIQAALENIFNLGNDDE